MTATVSETRTKTPPDRVQPEQARAAIAQEGAFLLDVRGYDEFAAVHATGATCIPLPDIERRAGELPTDRPILCICASGNRSQLAVERLRSLGMTNVTDVLGGTKAWESAGLPVEKQKGVIPLERQVRGVAGFLVLAFSILGVFVSPAFHWGALFIGFMLFTTSLLGICPMMSLLKLMPWNRIAAQPTCAKGA